MSDRTDLKVDLLGSEVELTGKKMKNGQTRRRVRMGDITVTITTASVAAWEDAHFHKGSRETYTVIKGRMALAIEDGKGDSVHRDVHLLSPGMSVTTEVGDAHNVYLYADTVIGVFVYDEPVGNPDRNGNDWWPASPEFDAWSKSLSEEEIDHHAHHVMSE